MTRNSHEGWSCAGGWLVAILLPGFLFIFPALSIHSQAKNSCVECHASLPEPLGVNAQEFSLSIHAQKGLNCTSCHGGDPSSDDLEQSMSPAAGFKRNITRMQIALLCGKCHSDAAYMRTFNPSLRTDQFSQYQTSVHGKLLAKGDTHVAVCTDCHTTHNIHPPNDPQSSVYPLNVAQTCANCHANAEYMKGYKIPTNQFSLYSSSVHHEALTDARRFKRPDLFDMPRQPWRRAPGCRFGRASLLHLSCLPAADIRLRPAQGCFCGHESFGLHRLPLEPRNSVSD